MYNVINTYGIQGTSNHYEVERALNECKKREGFGWIVVDQDGYQWDFVNREPKRLEKVDK